MRRWPLPGSADDLGRLEASTGPDDRSVANSRARSCSHQRRTIGANQTWSGQLKLSRREGLAIDL